MPVLLRLTVGVEPSGGLPLVRVAPGSHTCALAVGQPGDCVSRRGAQGSCLQEPRSLVGEYATSTKLTTSTQGLGGKDVLKAEVLGLGEKESLQTAVWRWDE